jgi:UDP-N-acetylmuramoylalanine--D-glutamate ligase
VVSFTVQGKRVVVVGAGRSGQAAARLLHARGASVTVSDADAAAFDRHWVPGGSAGIRTEAGPLRPETLRGADLIVLSPGVPSDLPAIAGARQAGVPVIGEIELASRWLQGRIIAITGTKGKSTTTSLTAEMLREAGMPTLAGGNLGTALSTHVDGSQPDLLHIVEVSSFQLETTDTFHPWIAVLLNLSPDHLDRHGSVHAYAAAKARVFRNQTADDWAVVNADDPEAVRLARDGRARRFDFALDAPLDNGVTVDGDTIVERRGGRTRPVLPRAAVRLRGRHLLTDVLAASAVGLVAGVPPAAIERAVSAFRGLEHALEYVDTIDGVQFVNDSKATNVIASRRALESFASGVVVIMGGRDKGGRFEELSDAVAGRVAAIVTIGEAAGRIASALGPVAPIVAAATMDAAVQRAFGLARPGGVILLAPACASFDMFTDYADRGRAFKAAVRRLAAGGTENRTARYEGTGRGVEQ